MQAWGVQQVERRELPTAHDVPPACCLGAKKCAAPGHRRGWAAESHIQAANGCPSPTRHAPAPAFCSRSTQHFLPTHGTLSAHSAALRSPAGPGRKRTGLMCTEAGAGGGEGLLSRATGLVLASPTMSHDFAPRTHSARSHWAVCARLGAEHRERRLCVANAQRASLRVR